VNVTVTDACNTSAFFDWNRSLRGYWSMDYYNSTGVYDNSTYDNFGTFNGADFGTDNITTGKYGNALDFNGSSDYVNCGDLDISETTLTVSFWMKPGETLDSSTGRRDIVAKRNAYWFLYDWQNGQLSWIIGDGGTHLDYTTTFNQDTWYHIVGVRESDDNTRLYINGDEKATGTSQTASAAGSNYNLFLGNSDGNSNHYDGLIDEVLVWRRTLSWEEINASYNATSSYYHNFTGLAVYNYSYYAYAIDSNGDHNQTATRYFEVISNTLPTVTGEQPANGSTGEPTQQPT